MTSPLSSWRRVKWGGGGGIFHYSFFFPIKTNNKTLFLNIRERKEKEERRLRGEPEEEEEEDGFTNDDPFKRVDIDELTKKVRKKLIVKKGVKYMHGHIKDRLL